MSRPDERPVVPLGPHATVFAVLEAYPFLREFLTEYDEAFRRISPSGGRPGWARVTTLGDVAVEMDVTWRCLVSDIARKSPASPAKSLH